MCRFISALLCAIGIFVSSAHAQAPRPPDFGPNVLVFDPSMPDIQKRLDAVFATQQKGEFNAHRYAYLFKPGNYSLDVQVGYYMQVLGLFVEHCQEYQTLWNGNGGDAITNKFSRLN